MSTRQNRLNPFSLFLEHLIHTFVLSLLSFLRSTKVCPNESRVGVSAYTASTVIPLAGNSNPYSSLTLMPTSSGMVRGVLCHIPKIILQRAQSTSDGDNVRIFVGQEALNAVHSLYWHALVENPVSATRIFNAWGYWRVLTTREERRDPSRARQQFLPG